LSATLSSANKKSFNKIRRIFSGKSWSGSSEKLLKKRDFEKKQRRKRTNN
jgi:hypothetical protein